MRRLLLGLVLIELFIGGGGRLLNVGALSLRMYLFIISILFAFFFLKKAPQTFVLLLVVTASLVFFSSALGYYNGAPSSLILNDVKPLLSFFLIFFFATVIRTKEDVFFIKNLIQNCALLMGVLYLFVFAALNLGFVNFNNIYALLAPTEEFFFRGNFAFFYKGFVYLCVGIIFYFSDPRKSVPAIIILMASVVLTFTRGFILSLLLVYAFERIFIKKRIVQILTMGCVTILFAWVGWSFVNSSNKLNRQESNQGRILQIKEVGNELTVSSLIIGHGFGVGISLRKEHMEISYLEITHKQGLIGLAFWLFLILTIHKRFQRAYQYARFREISSSFYLSCIFIYLLSFTNPFVNNPIGISFLVLSLVCLHVLSKASEQVQIERNW